MMTEDEAMTKWCPMARVNLDYGDYATSANRGATDDTDPIHTDSRCIASCCMAWRKVAHTVDRATGLPASMSSMLAAVKAGADAGQFESRWSEHGYCGLAGRPE